MKRKEKQLIDTETRLTITRLNKKIIDLFNSHEKLMNQYFKMVESEELKGSTEELNQIEVDLTEEFLEKLLPIEEMINNILGVIQNLPGKMNEKDIKYYNTITKLRNWIKYYKLEEGV